MTSFSSEMMMLKQTFCQRKSIAARGDFVCFVEPEQSTGSASAARRIRLAV